jgi:hypothetical protein
MDEKLLTREELLTGLAELELAFIERLAAQVLGPDACREQKDAMGAIVGHSMRLGAMFLDSHESRGRRTAAGREASHKARRPDKDRRDQAIDADILANPEMPVKALARMINAKLKLADLEQVSTDYLYKRRKLVRLTD